MNAYYDLTINDYLGAFSINTQVSNTNVSWKLLLLSQQTQA